MSAEEAVSLVSSNQSDALQQYAKLMYARTELASGCTLVILSPITVTTNILLLTAIFKDPLKYFKKPTSYFIVGLSGADLLCGLFVEPIFAAHYFGRYFEASEKFQAISQTLFLLVSIIATASLNASFIMVLMLSVVQFIAIEYPYRYKTWIKKKFVLPSVLITWVYFTIFSLLPLFGFDQVLFFKLNLTMHSTLIAVVLAIIQILTYRAFRGHSRHQKFKRLASSFSSPSHSDSPQNGNTRKFLTKKRGRGLDRNFIIMTFYLSAILLFSALPHIGVFYIFLYKQSQTLEEELIVNVLLRVTDLLLFVKVAADAFIFAWRLPSYRKSLDFLITGKVPELETGV
ncbi:hypothetical protein OS493_016076 [Desmophyllum pertusum]|uniref:G-protein coupled receptors family 1 profile domain-containing protein n=1 Tax=Desmophyllum pertusum TaxID=174260 RepID=A0A9X0A1L0_9CNID|nr:hypothetical protein OS493_016076 [Desmophyllum pertusum]